MTRHDGVLASAAFPSPCEKCEHLRVQAEQAFTELRHEADAHIAAVQKKLRDDFGKEIAKLKSANQQLQSELSFALKKSGSTPQDVHAQNRVHALEAEVKALEKQRKDEFNRAARESESFLKQHNAEVSMLEGKLINSETRVTQLTDELYATRLSIENCKGQLQNHSSESEHHITRLEGERDDLILSNNALKVRLAAVDKARHELEMERARQDLAYRRRIGEMEMEVRRSDIESVRLRNQVLALTQKIESLEFSSYTPTPKLPLSCESEGCHAEAPRIGRITRLHPSTTLSDYPADTPKSGKSLN